MNFEELESGELSDKSFYFKSLTWKFPYAKTLVDLVDYKVQSPTFSFAGSTWKFVIYPYGQTRYETEGFVDLMMIRLNSQCFGRCVFYKFCFITRNGKEFESVSHSTYFYSHFDKAGVTKYLKKSVFISNEKILASNEIITFTCEMRTEKLAVVDGYSQVESPASLLQSPKENSDEEPELSETPICKGCACELSHSSPLTSIKALQDLKDLFLKQEDCDVIIKVKEQEFKAHKAILIARSTVFASTFRNDMKEKSTGIIDIEDCDPSSFSDFLCFLYCGTVEILTTENVYSLFFAADKYDVQDLRSECIEFMKWNLSVDTFCETLTLALQHLEKELIDLATNFFAKHFQEIIVTVKWQRFVIEYPVQSNEIMVKALVPNKK